MCTSTTTTPVTEHHVTEHRAIDEPRSAAARVATHARTPGLWVAPVAVLLADQLTKAIQPAGTFAVNTGGAAVIPGTIGDALWQSHTFGAVTDTVDAMLLVIALHYSRRLPGRYRLGALVSIAGAFSNLADRLGTASLAHSALPRGAIDWIPLWAGVRANLADFCIAAGLLLASSALVLHAARAARRIILRPSHRLRVLATTAALIAVAAWSGIWQANRDATLEQLVQVHQPPPACVAQSWVNIEEWISRGCASRREPGHAQHT